MKTIKGFYIGFTNGYITLSDVIDENNNYYPKLVLKSSQHLDVKFNSYVKITI